VDEGGVSADAAAVLKSPNSGRLAEGDGRINWAQDSSSDHSAGPVMEIDATRPTGRTPKTQLSAFGEIAIEALEQPALRARANGKRISPPLVCSGYSERTPPAIALPVQFAATDAAAPVIVR